MSNSIKASVIISTYNQPEWLDLVLYSYTLQTEKHFEVIIADDGSGKDTLKVISHYKKAFFGGLKHIWHEDNGFQKTTILNKALESVGSDYIIFTDGDCIARKDFVATHLQLRKPNFALSGGYYKLNQEISHQLTKLDLDAASCFEKGWLLSNGQQSSFKMNKLTRNKFKARLLDFLTPTKATFDGMNVSCWKEDIVAVNGFDERMRYGGEDREVGERMMNNGVRFKQVRYRAICLHLYHERPYKNSASESENKTIRATTKKNKTTWTAFGLLKSKMT